MTNEVGEYAFTSVLPGTYTVRVSLPGFKTEERKGFRIGTQQSLVLDFMLRGRRALGADHRHRRSAARRARQRDAGDLARQGGAAEPADLRPQHLLCGDLDPGRHSDGRPAVRALPGSVRLVVALARRRPASRQRLPDRRRVDHRLHEPSDDRAVDGSGRRAEGADQDLRGRHGARRRRRLQHHGAIGVEHMARQRAAGQQAGCDDRQLFFAKKARGCRIRRSTTTTGPGRSAVRSSRTRRSSGSAPTTTSSAARATTC